MAWGRRDLRHTERDVFNNIFVQEDGTPGVGFIGMKNAEKLREGGNLVWGITPGTKPRTDHFRVFRASRLFEESRIVYKPGWTMEDRVGDPKFVRLLPDQREPGDLALQSDSAALNAGIAVPADWPDPLRDVDQGPPDSGALPYGGQPWKVGVGGRIPLSGGI